MMHVTILSTCIKEPWCRARASYYRLVRPLHAHVNKLGGSGGMLPEENFLN